MAFLARFRSRQSLDNLIGWRARGHDYRALKKANNEKTAFSDHGGSVFSIIANNDPR